MWAFCDKFRWNPLESCYNRNFSSVGYPGALISRFGFIRDLFGRFLEYHKFRIVFWWLKIEIKTLRQALSGIQPTPTAPCVANFSRFFLLDRVYIWILDTHFCVWSATWTRKPGHLMLVPKIKKSESQDPVEIHSNSVVTGISHLWDTQTRWYWHLDGFLIRCTEFWSVTRFALCFGAEKSNSRPCAELEMRPNLLNRPIFREFPYLKIFVLRFWSSLLVFEHPPDCPES